MNAKQYLQGLGLTKIILVIRDAGCENLGEYVEKLTGVKPSGCGILTGGILLDADSWDRLEQVIMPDA